jgi:hypothetical protein
MSVSRASRRAATSDRQRRRRWTFGVGGAKSLPDGVGRLCLRRKPHRRTACTILGHAASARETFHDLVEYVNSMFLHGQGFAEVDRPSARAPEFGHLGSPFVTKSRRRHLDISRLVARRQDTISDTPAMSMLDVARRADVSVGTVSNLVDAVVATATRHRALGTVEDLGFVPNDPARRVASARSAWSP